MISLSHGALAYKDREAGFAFGEMEFTECFHVCWVNNSDTAGEGVLRTLCVGAQV